MKKACSFISNAFSLLLLLITVPLWGPFYLILYLLASPDEKEKKMLSTVEKINDIFNIDIPPGKLIEIKGIGGAIYQKISFDNEEELDQYYEWLESLPKKYPLNFFYKKKNDQDNLVSSCSIERGEWFDKEFVTGDMLKVVSSGKKYWGCFYFMDDGMIFRHGHRWINMQTIKDILALMDFELPTYEITSCDTIGGPFAGGDWAFDVNVKFRDMIPVGCFEKLKEACKSENDWSYNEKLDDTSISYIEVKHAPSFSNHISVIFWNDNMGNQLGSFSVYRF